MKSRLMLLLLMIPSLMFAQEEFKEPFVEVTGTAEQEVEPNLIYMYIRLREFEENRQKVSLEKLEKDFFEALKKAGIDRKRVELAGAGSKLDDFRKRDKDVFRQKSYQLKLTSSAELEKFLQSLESVKVDYVDITKLDHSEMEKIQMELKIKALQAARDKARMLVQGIGADIGKPLLVREYDLGPIYPMMEMKANVRMSADMYEAEESPAFRKIKLQARVMAQFEIK